VHGLRFNVWTSIVLFVVAAVYFVVSLRLWPGQEESPYKDGHVEGQSPRPALTQEGEVVDLGEPDAGAGGAHDPGTSAGSGPPA
jgi:hypothetical protein